VIGLLASIDDQQFLGGAGSGEHDFWLGDPVLDELSFDGVVVWEVLFFQMLLSEQITVDDDTCALGPGIISVHVEFGDHSVELFVWMLDDVHLVGDGSSGWGLISGNHNDLNTSRSALRDGQINTNSWGIVQGDETNEGEVVHGEGSFNVLIVGWNLGLVKTPGFPVLDIELVSIAVNVVL